MLDRRMVKYLLGVRGLLLGLQRIKNMSRLNERWEKSRVDNGPALMEKSIRYIARTANHIVRISFCLRYEQKIDT